jgi:OpgC protein
VPRNWRGLTTPVMRGAIRCGENSLPIYCLGVLLAIASRIALLNISDGLAMQIALGLAGILVMIAAAALLSSIRIKSRQQPRSVAVAQDWERWGNRSAQRLPPSRGSTSRMSENDRSGSVRGSG